ncbi:nitrous oxide reductase accessory protein NosL [Arenibacter sp. BSSL-BM3]|uniref:Nitrous oxide reductase accessory protein NosL n=1 Tax=Arenibacter arenosicollis TaxID=2762274 RepID=A0ABR7QS32_9FLAO|nr:nitrous oxide reductase accessory protein NosL [Arenibacter arenosicollis]MBC8769785.1 nitrous oxide reductase accessory protein NosL [Arenibacter arenosicollis]
MVIYRILIFLFLIFASSCRIGPQPIAYGSDGCHFCSMTIVDRQHAAEIVTDKGKVFKFDSSECMMNHVKDLDQREIALYLVNDFDRPGELIDATEATYLISNRLPSPMGEFLTAFKDEKAAVEALMIYEGDLMSWEQLKLRFQL